jgi:uncharacterized protein
MKKSFFTIFVSLILVFLPVIPSFALNGEYILDEVNSLETDEIDKLNEIAGNYRSEYRISFYYAYLSEKIDEFDLSELVDEEDYVVFLEDDYNPLIVTGGEADGFFGDSEKNRIYSVCFDAETPFDKVMCFFEGAASVLANGLSEEKNDDNSLFPSSKPERLYDEAGLLSDSEKKNILEKLNSLSEQYGTDFIIATVNTLGPYSGSDFAEEYFDRFEYGLGETRNGVMLLISMQERDYRILSNGIVGNHIDDDIIDEIGDAIVSDLSYGNYYKAFDEFINKSEYHVNGAINGYPFNYVSSIIISILIGFVVALFAVGSMKSKLKTVKPVNEANSYLREGSLKLSRANDRFLYATVSRSAKSSSSRSSRSRSGGGSRHVGGGKF